MKIDKSKLLFDKTIEIIQAIIYNSSYINIFKQYIPLELYPREFINIFTELYNTNGLDLNGVLFILRKNGFDYTKVSQNIIPQNIELRTKEFYDLYESIKTENIIRESLYKNENSIKGLDLLIETKQNLDDSLKKYSRFKKEKNYTDILIDTINQIEFNLHNENNLIKTQTYPSFNRLTGGINGGNLVVIAGAYKNGKTTFGLNLINDLANQGIPSLIFSLEMSIIEIMQKLIAIDFKIPHSNLRDPKTLTEQQLLTLKQAKSVTNNKKLKIFDNLLHINEIESTIKKYSEYENVKIVLIDYIGLIKTNFGKNNNIESREREISQLSNALKILAKETNTIIIVISQLNRAGYKDAISMNLAESIGLARDSDFLFTVTNPYKNDLKKIIVNNQEISVKENMYVCKLDSSRHSQCGRNIILVMDEFGIMKEIDLTHSVDDFDNEQELNHFNTANYYIKNQFYKKN